MAATDLELLAEPTRRAIVALLAEHPRRSMSVADALGVGPAALARHLRVLRQAGIVLDGRVVRDGRVRLYMLHPRRARAVMAWLATSGLADEESPNRSARTGTWPKRAYAVELGFTRVAVTGCEIRTITVREPVIALPLAAPGIVGVIEVGQAVVPVLDLASRLGLPPDADVGHARGWLLVDGRDGQFVVRADASTDLGLIERSAVSPVPRAAFAVGKESVIGIVRMTSRPMAFVDLDLI